MDASWDGEVSRNILGLRVTVTLTSDLVFRIIVSGAYLILFEIGISNLVCGCIWGDEVSWTIIGSL